MKLSELIEDASIETLKLRTDNPGGRWLEGKRKESVQGGLNEFGNPSRFGTITGTWNRKVLLPVDLVSKFKGLRGEQTRVRQHDFDSLHDFMSKNNHLPTLSDGKNQYAPFITVYQDGTPYVNEGNHRIMVAKKLGWKFIPVEVRYFNGGEQENGPLAPTKVKEFDAEAHAAGYSSEDFRAQ